MTSSKRRREVARAKAERQAARRAEAAQRRGQRNRILAIVAVVVVVGGVLAWVVLNRTSQDGDVAAPAETAIPTESAVPSDSALPSDSPAPSDSATPTDESTSQPDPDCAPAPQPRPDDMTWAKAPAEDIDPKASYTMNLATNCGEIVIEMLPREAPETVASMAFLTEEGYFDLTACHRLTTAGIYVLQCGDPAGNGTGGPGYAIPDENLPPEGPDNYPAGTVAMANAGPGTGGSQFFIVYANTTLPPGYTIWGTVTKGLDVVEGIAAAGVEGGGTDGPPAQTVVIEKATLTTSSAN